MFMLIRTCLEHRFFKTLFDSSSPQLQNISALELSLECFIKPYFYDPCHGVWIRYHAQQDGSEEDEYLKE